MTKLSSEWVRTSDPVIRSPARYHYYGARPLSNTELEQLVDQHLELVDATVGLKRNCMYMLKSVQTFIAYRGHMMSHLVIRITNSCTRWAESDIRSSSSPLKHYSNHLPNS